ncbi:hypothetical protein PIB30_022600 [Stylosanthes scabra]|uniref:Uncharacterized protein n=1 Tax=Stylosanthes scabra TaxID=79078 RepID=A0ABU6R9T9_9FABA|nr:hypothetical protein [Stylosanthes scabra]
MRERELAEILPPPLPLSCARRRKREGEREYEVLLLPSCDRRCMCAVVIENQSPPVAFKVVRIMVIPALMVIPASAVDSSWYPDTGASHHITLDPTNLLTSSEYTGSQQVQIGNGSVHKDGTVTRLS